MNLRLYLTALLLVLFALMLDSWLRLRGQL